MCCAWFVAACLMLNATPDEVSVANAGFEEAAANGVPAQWNGPPDVYQADSSVAFSGHGSLKFVNADAGRYVLCSQSIQLEPGRMYEVSARVKTQGIQGADSGATVCMECSDAQGKYIGGCYPSGIKGDTDWTLVRGISGRVPKDAARCTVSCYVRQGMTGTAWWDDVKIVRVKEDPLAIVLRVPNYRAQITDAGPRKAIVGARVDLTDYDPLTLKDVALTWNVLSNDHVVKSGKKTRIDKNDVALDIPAAALAPGAYVIEVSLINKATGEVVSTKRHALQRVKGKPDRAVYIDEHNRIIFHGEPFFPLGMYWSSVTKDELDIYADSAFNCLMPYGPPDQQQLDLCHERGLKVIYSVKDIYYGTQYCPGNIKSEAEELPFIKTKVEAFRNHPALLAWYINDELGLDLLGRLTQRRDQMESLDPDHPAWAVLYQVDQVAQYLPTFDIIGTDPYPIPDRPAAMAGEWSRKTVTAVQHARPVWQVPQVFNWACYRTTDAEKQKCRPPTLEEMRSMAWQCIAEGANGLIFYSWMDPRRDTAAPFEQSWPRVKTVAQEIKAMIPVLLSTEKPPRIEAPNEAWLDWTTRRLGRTTYLIAVNNAPQPSTAEFVLSQEPKTVHFSDGTSLTRQGKRLTVQFEPLAVRIVELTP